MQPLKGKRVLDLSRLLPGPFCSRELGRLGAEVIKVEEIEGGDYLRLFQPQIDGMSAYFHALNRGKKSICLNLKSDEGQQIFLRLVRDSDVVIESFRPGVLEALGLDFARLQAANRGVILCSISGYGQTGARRRRAGHDLNYMALTGALAATGTRDGELAIPAVQIADLAGGAMSATIAVLAALMEREQTGEGRHLDISMYAGVLDWLEPHFLAYETDGRIPGPGCGLLTGGVPAYALYRCADGWMAVAALEPKFWRRLTEVLQLPEFADAGLSRGDEAQRAQSALQEKFARHTRAEWMEIFGDQDLCCEPVWTVGEAAADDEVQRIRAARTDVHADPAPPAGRDTAGILRAAGFSAEEITGLQQRGIVA